MGYLDGKVNDYFDKEFDFDKDEKLDEMERYMQFDIINKLQHDTREDNVGNRYVENAWAGDDDEDNNDSSDYNSTSYHTRRSYTVNHSPTDYDNTFTSPTASIEIQINCNDSNAANQRESEARTAPKHRIPLIKVSLVTVIILLTAFIIYEYNNAVRYLDEGKYRLAYEQFRSLGFIGGSNRKADLILEKHPTVGLQKGDIVVFGSYEQDNNPANGQEPIEWIILADDGQNILLMSKAILDCQPFNIGTIGYDWLFCSLRDWLNEEFYENAFSQNERSCINTGLSDKKEYIYIKPSSIDNPLFILSSTSLKPIYGIEYNTISDLDWTRKELQSEGTMYGDVLPPLSLCLEVGASCSRPEKTRFHRLSPGVPRFFIFCPETGIFVLLDHTAWICYPCHCVRHGFTHNSGSAALPSAD